MGSSAIGLAHLRTVKWAAEIGAEGGEYAQAKMDIGNSGGLVIAILAVAFWPTSDSFADVERVTVQSPN